MGPSSSATSSTLASALTSLAGLDGSYLTKWDKALTVICPWLTAHHEMVHERFGPEPKRVRQPVMPLGS